MAFHIDLERLSGENSSGLAMWSEVAITCPRPSFRVLQMVQEQEAGKGNFGQITVRRGVEDLWTTSPA